MKKTTLSKYIIIKATAFSDWDNCEFAILELTREWLDLLRTRHNLLPLFKDDSSFFHLSFWDAPVGFYSLPGEADRELLEEVTDSDNQWAFVELDEKELETFTEPESILDGHQMHVYADGSARFKAIGEYSNVEFSTDPFRITDFLAIDPTKILLS